MPTPILICFLICSYLLGSISSAIILSNIMGFPDPRSGGSQNPGATNVLRVGGKKAAFFTLVGDMLKGFLPVFIASLFSSNLFELSIIGFAAFIGHCYPVFYSFKGGKGVATAIGTTLAFDWVAGFFVISIWLIVAKVFKLSALAALIAFLLLPAFIYWLFQDTNISLVFAITTSILFIRHKANIIRIINGEEKL